MAAVAGAAGGGGPAGGGATALTATAAAGSEHAVGPAARLFASPPYSATQR